MLILFIFDGLIIGGLTFGLVKLILGDNTFSRFLSVVLSIGTGTGDCFKAMEYATYYGDSMTVF